mgnify:CR=1 FL=1
MDHTLPAEWAPQDAILLAWPHENTDWAPILDEARRCFFRIIETISRFQRVVVLLNDHHQDFSRQSFSTPENVSPVIVPFNDTWARDFGPLVLTEGSVNKLLDFKFNGWGLKFAADQDNLINQRLLQHQVFDQKAVYENHLDFVLEGGSIESDGEGTLLTTSQCLLTPNRNGVHSKEKIEDELKTRLGVHRICWIDHGYLEGDDTDSHIDTLARFCNSETIAYVKCTDTSDPHYKALAAMEKQLQSFQTGTGRPFHLLPLPMADPVIENHQRLPATYANFLIINGAVLVPFYNSEKDMQAQKTLQQVFPDRKVIGVDCTPLIRQNGSLHCVTMQLPEGVLNKGTLEQSP